MPNPNLYISENMPKTQNTEQALNSAKNGVTPPFYDENTFKRVDTIMYGGCTICNKQADVQI